MQKTLVTFSRTLILKVRIIDTEAATGGVLKNFALFT